MFNQPIYLEPKKEEVEESQLEDRSAIYTKKHQNKNNNSDYFNTNGHVNESIGESLDEFITPDIITERTQLNDNGNNNHKIKLLLTILLDNEPTYFQRLIDIPTELKDEDEHNKTGIGWDEIEPELPSDSYFIMILPSKYGPYGEELPNMTDIESSNEISHSDSSASKNISLLAPNSQPKRLFY